MIGEKSKDDLDMNFSAGHCIFYLEFGTLCLMKSHNKGKDT